MRKPKGPLMHAKQWCSAVVMMVVVLLSTGCASQQQRWRRMSDAELVALIGRREHQVVSYWRGENPWVMSANGYSSGGHFAFEFEHTPSYMVEKTLCDTHVREVRGRLAKDPLLLTPLFQSKDPEVVLTAIYAYGQVARVWGRHWLAARPEARQLADEIRTHLLSHKDVRIRYAAFELMEECGWLSFEDVAGALDDESLSIRKEASIVGLNQVMRPLGRIRRRDGTVEPVPGAPTGRAATFDADDRLRRKLVPLMIKHLDDPHFFIRTTMYQGFRSLLGRWRPTSATGYTVQYPPGMPKRIDWARAGWPEYTSAKKELEDWWAANGAGAMRFASYRG